MINIQLCGRATAVNCKEEHRRNHHNFQLILQSHHDASISSIHITLSLSCLVRNQIDLKLLEVYGLTIPKYFDPFFTKNLEEYFSV